MESRNCRNVECRSLIRAADRFKGASALSSRLAIENAPNSIHFELCIWGYPTTSTKAEHPNADPNNKIPLIVLRAYDGG